MTNWKNKLLAFLHDPPHKPFRIAGHENARESFLREVGLTGLALEDFHFVVHGRRGAERRKAMETRRKAEW
jgi:hypothetical protein